MKKYTFILLITTLACFFNAAKTIAQPPEKIWFAIKDGLDNQSLMNTIENNTSLFLTACNEATLKNKKPDFSSDLFAKNSKQQVMSFWETSPMYCSKMYISEKCLKRASGGYQVRNIPIFIPGAPEESQNQEIVINYTVNGKIDNIAISVDETRYKEILEEYNTLEDFNRRQIILDFLENFRTAYNTKDLKYIGSIFSEQALIITGKVVKQVQTKDVAINRLLGSEKIVYITQTKPEYLQNLKSTFSNNKYIDVGFEDIEVVRHPKNDKLYGVTLKQKWGSSNYRDTGYLFLMIDFKDEAHPMIHVRTWQPAQFKGEELPKDKIFKLNDFNIQNM